MDQIVSAAYSVTSHRNGPRKTRLIGEKANYQCACGQAVFFRNSVCLACSSPLGFAPDRGEIVPLSPAGEVDTWRITDDPKSQVYLRCANLTMPAGCNWLVPQASGQTLCVACQLNRTIPDLSVEGNGERWHKIEAAKRRLVAQLLDLGLPLISKAQNEETGLAFDLLGTDAEGQNPMTGHSGGLITLNVAEADDAHRERMRAQLHEPYRTLLGHFRHEVGHYYWDRLIAGSGWLADYRQLFGDERMDYGEALQRHYDNSAPADWQQSYVSAYATMHPWEDWAETWAHYLHMMDTLDTAVGFGMTAMNSDLDYIPYTRDVLYDPHDEQGDDFIAFVNAWIEMAAMLNELARSMGQPDTYPFVLPAPVIAKLHFIHRVVQTRGNPPSLANLNDA
ncbi:putative zinc-binding metallopeptidase [Pseudomonas sp.]|uniref:zinc-binding metallopeptidase family protein n=1 Tax=Pseudomonas sp. TaxID=306 RepID=UPI00391816E3